MEITSLNFLVFVVATVLLFNLAASQVWRTAIFTAANGVFLWSYVTDLRQLLPLAGFLFFGYGMVAWARTRRSAAALVIGIGLTLILYIFLKRFSFIEGLPALPFPYLVVGLSYILFRLLHLMIDVSNGDLRVGLGPLRFFNYTCNFLTFISGPIQRYQDFSNGGLPIEPDVISQSFARVVTGYVKVMVVSGIANYLMLKLSHQILSPDSAPAGASLAVHYAAAATAYTLYLYYNFSGYMDIVIGVGRLLGQKLPENFNKPFLARNFLELWSRWHMTLSEWFKIYLFNPLMTYLVERVPQPNMLPYLGVAAFFVTFFVMGIWHGTTPVFMIYGLLMGLGASANKLWQVWMTRRLGRSGYRVLADRTAYIYACRGLTCAYFTIGVTCLWVDLPQLLRLWGSLGPVGLGSAVLLIAAPAGLAMFLQDSSTARLRRWLARERLSPQSRLLGTVWSAAQIWLVVIVSSWFHKAPEFVYRAF